MEKLYFYNVYIKDGSTFSIECTIKPFILYRNLNTDIDFIQIGDFIFNREFIKCIHLVENIKDYVDIKEFFNEV